MQLRKQLAVVVILLIAQLSLSVTTSDLGGIQIRYGTVSYANDGKDWYTSNLTLTNTAAADLDGGSQTVTLYVCFIRLVIGSNSRDGVLVNKSPKITVYHLDGCAHRMVISAPFTLRSGQKFSFTMKQKDSSVSYTDVMPNWYIQLGEGEHQLIRNTNQDQVNFVDPFDTKEKYLRSKNDLVFPLTLEERHKYQVKLYPTDSEHVRNRLVPDVLEPFRLNEQTEYTSAYSIRSPLPMTYTVDGSLKKGQAQLSISKDGKIVAKLASDSKSGRDIAESIVRQMLERFNDTLPVGDYRTKAPRYEYRGFMIDIARQFHGKDVIKRQLDLMRRYKLNVLHFHLIDDESWALEIDDIPELTQYGSKQCFNISECATYPQLGRNVADVKSYLTKAEYIEIVRYADFLGITVIPEVELPGHATAAIQAMQLRYENSPNKADYRLHDPRDKTRYMSVQYFTNGAMNPCLNSTNDFIEAVVLRLKAYHTEAGQELKIVHLGGDEIASGAWVSSPACYHVFSTLLANATSKEKEMAVKAKLLKSLGKLAESQNLSLGLWEDGLIDKTTNKPFIKDEIFPSTVDVYCYIWQTVWEWWGGDRAFNMANGGYKVVMAPATRYYMDHPQEPHPNEHGYYWATRSTNLLRTFSFRPENYYANIDGIRRYGAPITEASWCNPSKCPPLVHRENIVGIEAPLFGETIRDQDDMDNNVWPRLLAVAERAWNEGVWEKHNASTSLGLQQDFDTFRQAVEQYEIPALERLHDVKYHLSPPGAKVVEEDERTLQLALSVEFRHQRVWWRKEDSKKFVEAVKDRIPYLKDTRIYLKTSNAAANRFSYEVPFQKDTEKPTTAAHGGFAPTLVSVTLIIWSLSLCYMI